MYAQVCTRPDLAFAVSVLGRFQSNPGQAHWVVAKKVLRYLQRTKNYKLVYRESKDLELVGYADADLGGCVDSMKSTSGSSTSELRTPVFNGENYEFWSIRMKTILKSHGLWDLVEHGCNDLDSKKEKEIE
ncbi:hypothetical protein L3X38_036124 [Prunus dulcis]|uniref:DUF4219 domain-containing protein n=1 Tax=Prunus dulcis TaxID=3755 RepID=A0AAD4YNA1_PRUDU|nr:hypothetical protein L3X38_036124 [Prunus dulcis]